MFGILLHNVLNLCVQSFSGIKYFSKINAVLNVNLSEAQCILATTVQNSQILQFLLETENGQAITFCHTHHAFYNNRICMYVDPIKY